MALSERLRRSGSFRRTGIFVLIAAGCGAAIWLLWQSWTNRTVNRPPSALGGAGGDMIAGMPPPGPGQVNARVRVRLFDESGEMPVGAGLEEGVSLKLLGVDGQSYEASFDRAGLWVMEVPAGEFVVPLEQESMGEWRWELAGGAVGGLTGKGYTVLFVPGQTPTLELALRK